MHRIVKLNFSFIYNNFYNLKIYHFCTDLGKAFTSGYLAVSSQATGREPRKEKPDFVLDLHDRIVKEGSPMVLHGKY